MRTRVVGKNAAASGSIASAAGAIATDDDENDYFEQPTPHTM